MRFERIYLDPTDNRVFIDAYIENSAHTHDAMLVIPGGGYGMVCTDREGEPIALAFLARGLNCFVLNYRVGQPRDGYPDALLDASRAMLYIRSHAVEFHINPKRVFCVGFSAGGHLAGALCTMYGEPEVQEPLGNPGEKLCPAGAVLSYPLISAFRAPHHGSFENLLHKPFDTLSEEEKRKHSIECRITENTPPMFIWHTAEDHLLAPDGALELTRVLVEKKVPVMMQLYPYGRHGLALSSEMTCIGDPELIKPFADRWVDDAVAWMKTLK